VRSLRDGSGVLLMSTTKTPPPYDDHGRTATVIETAGHGGRLATLLSAFALLFSGYTFYESVLKAPALEVHIPPVINYARDDAGSMEVLAIPLTIANSGARTGTVLSAELEIKDPTSETTKKYYSAYIGEHPKNAEETKQAFAPISIPGRGVYSNTILFYPAGEILPALVTKKGDYELTLKLNVAEAHENGLITTLTPPPPEPISVTMTLPYFSIQSLSYRRATIPMHTADWQPTSSAGPVE
jgi:hypothetical protein